MSNQQQHVNKAFVVLRACSLEATSCFSHHFPLSWQEISSGPSGEGPESQLFFLYAMEQLSDGTKRLRAATWKGFPWSGPGRCSAPRSQALRGFPLRHRHPAQLEQVKPRQRDCSCLPAPSLESVTCLQDAHHTCR